MFLNFRMRKGTEKALKEKEYSKFHPNWIADTDGFQNYKCDFYEDIVTSVPAWLTLPQSHLTYLVYSAHWSEHSFTVMSGSQASRNNNSGLATGNDNNYTLIPTQSVRSSGSKQPKVPDLPSLIKHYIRCQQEFTVFTCSVV